MDLILHSGNIYTLDPHTPRANALAVKDGKIVAVGRNDEILALRREETRCVDLLGKTVIPGFNDCHNHLISAGLRLGELWLFGDRSIASIKEKLAAKVKEVPEGEWIQGVGWLETLFEEKRFPNKWDLDEVAPNHPVCLDRIFNMIVCNSKALEMAGITADTPNPPLGQIDKDPETGEPTGIIRDRAKSLLTEARGMKMSTWDLVAGKDDEELLQKFRKAIVRAGREYVQNGITSVCDPGLDPLRMLAYNQSLRAGELPLRVTMMPEWYGFSFGHSCHFDEAVLSERMEHWGYTTGFGNEWLRVGPLKMSLDGGLGSGGAYLWEPYVGEKEVKVHLRVPPEKLADRVYAGHKNGWSVGIHCIGDRGQDLICDAYREAQRRMPRQDVRHSIIHAYFPTEKALSIMKEYDISANVQPVFLYMQGDKYPGLVGLERAHRFKPLRTYLDRGIRVACNSDVPTGYINPFVGLYTAVTRKTVNGLQLGEAERISVEEALPLFTKNGAYYTFEEDIKGVLRPGMLADMAVLDRDILAIDPEELLSVKVKMTIIGGNIVWEAE